MQREVSFYGARATTCSVQSVAVTASELSSTREKKNEIIDQTEKIEYRERGGICMAKLNGFENSIPIL